MDQIEITGARVHNLKNISLSIPKNQLVVITGISGSGKSSLAFDTIFAEGQRRYMESFSAYARQFMGDLERPDVDKISGLSPVISIEQKTTNRNPRSTVGTVTETSAFRWQDDRVIPEHYHYSQTGLSAREETVAFDWQAMSARSSRDEDSWTLPLSSGVQDKLSYSQNIGTDIDTRGLTLMRYTIVDTDEIEEQVYALV